MFSNKPMAAPGLTSYRLPSQFGYCMIGARDADEAMREASRSVRNPLRSRLEVWDASQRKYVPAR